MSKPPVVAMMMAMDRNKLIGSNGTLPWHIPGELSYFKQVTMGKPVIMGRKTFDSIGKPLGGRTNIVITRNPSWTTEGVLVATSLEQALELACEQQGHAVENITTVTQSALDMKADAQTAAHDGVLQTGELMIIGGAAVCREAMPLTQRLYLTVIDHSFEGDTWLDSFHWDQWRAISEDVRDPATTGGLPVTYWVLERVRNF